MTVWFEMVKWAQQYTHARDRAGVHYWSDGCTGMFLGEIMTIRYIIADLSIRPRANPVTGEEERRRRLEKCGRKKHRWHFFPFEAKDGCEDEDKTQTEVIVKPLMDGRNVVITAQGVRLFGSSDPPTMRMWRASTRARRPAAV